ncbi:AI-2E family transporter [Candidatus Latescibacterota bacterium]
MEIKKFGFYFLLGIIILIALKFYTIIYNFFPSIAAGCVFAYLFHPVYEYLKKKTRKKSLSAFIIIFMIFVLILVPISLIGSAVPNQIQSIFNEDTVENLRGVLDKGENLILSIFSRFNINPPDFQININDFLPRLISPLREAITAFGPKMLISITSFLLYAFVTIFIMYYLLINSEYVIKVFKNYFPLSYNNSTLLLDEMGKNTKSLILGQLMIAVVQGTLGAIGFFICGISGAILWGFVMAIMSFIPVFGSGIVWFPATLFLLAKGEYFNTIGLFFWGSLIISTSDNILRPKLTSSLGKLHPVTVLLGVFIGLKEWGLIGIVIGPLTISVLLILIKMFREEYLDE